MAAYARSVVFAQAGPARFSGVRMLGVACVLGRPRWPFRGLPTQVAEAWGAHLAMLLLRERPDGDKRVRISGLTWLWSDTVRLKAGCAGLARKRSWSQSWPGWPQVAGASRGRRSVDA